MKRNVLKRLVAIGLTCGSMAVLSPIAANAAWKEENGNRYYLNESGQKVTGWIYDTKNWYYLNEQGIMQKDKTIIENGEKYVLGSDGVWNQDKKNENKSGKDIPDGLIKGEAVKIEWVNKNHYWYAMKDGKCLTGFVKDLKGNYFYMDENGVMQSNKVITVNGVQYKIGADGICKLL